MTCHSRVAIFFLVLGLLAGGKCRADVEDNLLGKFQNQNQEAGAKLKQEANRTLANAGSPGNPDTGKNLEKVRDLLAKLYGDTCLPPGERSVLISRTRARLGELKGIEQKRRQLAKAEAARKKLKAIQVSPAVGGINLGLGTTVTVPDGGTAYLGGYGTSWSGRNEMGAPILGHIPLLGRGFRNVAYGQTTTGVGITVRARIIILEEMEP